MGRPNPDPDKVAVGTVNLYVQFCRVSNETSPAARKPVLPPEGDTVKTPEVERLFGEPDKTATPYSKAPKIRRVLLQFALLLGIFASMTDRASPKVLSSKAALEVHTLAPPLFFLTDNFRICKRYDAATPAPHPHCSPRKPGRAMSRETQPVLAAAFAR